MTQEEIILKAQDFLRAKFGTEKTGHDYWHMHRTWKVAKHIAAHESGADIFTVELAALLHDIADPKFHKADAEAGPRAARKWLETVKVDDTIITHVEEIIRNHSFSGADVRMKLNTIEGQIVHDADKLDAMGAIGIARAFATGAHFKETMHDPDIPVPSYKSAEEYHAAKGSAQRTVINHFYEKLLLLKDRMYTNTGRDLAQHRHEIMEQFLKEFLEEWDGKR